MSAKTKHYGFVFHITKELFQTDSHQYKNVLTNGSRNSWMWRS